ncbi:unnamed protein product, partial [Ixodes pacificus]
MEKMRRSNLFWSLESGGFGLVNVTLKLYVQRFLFFRDQRDPIFTTALHCLGYGDLQQWMVSTTSRATTSRHLRYYKEVADSIRFFLVHFSWEYLLTVKRKTLYWDTVSAVLPVPLYRQRVNAPNSSDVFKQLRKLPVPTSSKDFFVRFHVEVLPVKVWLDKKGFFVPWSLNCALCGATETLHHVFVECSNAYLFWAELKCLFTVEFEIVWNVFKWLCLESEEHSPTVLRVLVVLGLHAIWRS